MNNEKIKDQISNTIKNPKKKGPYILGQTLGEGAFAKVKVATQIHCKSKGSNSNTY